MHSKMINHISKNETLSTNSRKYIATHHNYLSDLFIEPYHMSAGRLVVIGPPNRHAYVSPSMPCAGRVMIDIGNGAGEPRHITGAGNGLLPEREEAALGLCGLRGLRLALLLGELGGEAVVAIRVRRILARGMLAMMLGLRGRGG